MCTLPLYYFGEVGTLECRAAAQRAGVVGSSGDVARAIRGLLRPRGTTRGIPPLSAWAAERQSTQVDERDAGSCQQSWDLSGLSALHYARPVERRTRLAPTAPGDPRSRGCADSRRDELPQAGTALGRRRAPVLRQPGEGRELSGGSDRRAVDGYPRLDAG